MLHNGPSSKKLKSFSHKQCLRNTQEESFHSGAVSIELYCICAIVNNLDKCHVQTIALYHPGTDQLATCTNTAQSQGAAQGEAALTPLGVL